ncbi:clathrin coat assembly protein ap17 [Trichophyton equinum CBS 127.97]|uniref:Clathrin coat assembly protein ap17 n=1 Tax=Trichophyton equinum (strain ATCC MYA-4606 / CBS 127.97) TaxID=559882 RepID=F2PR79_TRIEC|nr:clathrin coat assembly protein ap17 [Trichophyton equinum CBS 127.97]
MVLSFIIVQNRQGKTRLAKWYAPYNDDEKVRLKGEVHRLVAPRDQKYQSNFVEFKRSTKIVYRRYAGLFFCVCVDANDNELAYLEAIHFFVEVLDQFFGRLFTQFSMRCFLPVKFKRPASKLCSQGWSTWTNLNKHLKR